MRRRGMTLIELLMAAVIMSVLAALAMPLLISSDEERLLGVARLLEQDAAWARSATLTDPADPAMLRLLPAGTGWEVVRMSDPTTAIEAVSGLGPRRDDSSSAHTTSTRASCAGGMHTASATARIEDRCTGNRRRQARSARTATGRCGSPPYSTCATTTATGEVGR